MARSSFATRGVLRAHSAKSLHDEVLHLLETNINIPVSVSDAVTQAEADPQAKWMITIQKEDLEHWIKSRIGLA